MKRCFMKRWRTAAVMLLLLTCSMSACSKGPSTGELIVFAAASTADAMDEIGRDFAAETGQKVVFSFGASRDLGRQIRAGAPAAIIVSADAEIVDTLVEAKLVRSDDVRVFASNRLVVIVAKGSDLRIGSGRDLARVPRVAVGDPALAPAGKYARHWLENEGVWTEVAPRIVPSLDVRAALAAVENGHAEAGIVYRTDAACVSGVRIAFEVPAEKTPTISYVAARLASADESARRFLHFLTAPKARATYVRLGFIL
jgi:molybdate transport system substrate-binding protein